MNFRLIYLAVLVFLAACDKSETPQSDSKGTFTVEEIAAAQKAAQDEIDAFKKTGLDQAATEIAVVKEGTEAAKRDLEDLQKKVTDAKAELDALKTSGGAKANEIALAEQKLTELKDKSIAAAKEYAATLQKLGRTPEAVEVLKSAGLTQEASDLLSQVVVQPTKPYEPFPTLYKVTLADGTKGLPAPKSPPMGWNAWNTFQCNVDETLILQIADTLHSSGMAKAGYTSVNLDDCWEKNRIKVAGEGRDKDGRLQIDTEKFPSGIKALAAKIHEKGLKLGIYSSAGKTTCQGFAGSLDHEVIDAQTFADWDIDYVKYDNCWGPKDRSSFMPMRDALVKTGRNMFYSANFDGHFGNFDLDAPLRSDDPVPNPQLDVPAIVHAARVADDVTHVFTNLDTDNTNQNSLKSVTRVLELGSALAGRATPGFWNDFDMLQVGNLATDEENKTHFGMWAMMASPLLAGNDIRKQSPQTLKILTNPDVIAVNQDPLNIQAVIVREDKKGLQVWNKPLVGSGARAVALLNLTSAAATISVKWTDLGLDDKSAKVRVLSTRTDIGDSEADYSANVPSHGVVILTVDGSEIPFPSGTSSLSDQKRVYEVNGWGPVEKDQSNGESLANDGTKLQIGEVTFNKGLGVSTRSNIVYRPDAKCIDLSIDVGVDHYYATKTNPEKKGRGNVSFEIWGDGNLLAESGVMKPTDKSKLLKADLKNVSTLRLVAKPGGDFANFDYGDWANPVIICK